MIRGGKLGSFGEIAKILGKEGLCDLGFDISKGKLMAQQALALTRVEEEMPSTSDNIKLQMIMKDAARSTENLTK